VGFDIIIEDAVKGPVGFSRRKIEERRKAVS